MNNNAYVGYQAIVTDVTTGLSTMNSVCRNLNMDGQAEKLENLGDKLKNHVFSVGIMGEFKRGKSTVINALLGQDIVPADIVPCSATLNYVRWDTDKRAEIRFKDGTTSRVPVEQLSNFVTKLTAESEKNAENVDEAVVYYPTPFCQNGVQIVDTPGLNDDERMTVISENVIPTLDAIIMVIVPQSPFSESEAEFVRNKVMTSDLGRIIFVVNKVDLLDEDERPRILDHINYKIRKSVLEKTARVYGEDSAEYKATSDKLGKIRLIPVSAKRALKGKLKNDPAMVDESGYRDFEESLSYLLTEERGMLDLIHPINQLISTGKEALQTIETRLDALALSAEEFEQIQKESIAKIGETRAQKKAEIQRLKSKSGSLYYDLQPEVNVAYSEISTQIESFVSSYQINDADIADESAMAAFSEKISKEINSRIEESLAISTERLQNKIQENLGRDVESLKSFGEQFNQNLSDIRLNLTARTNGNMLRSVAVGTLAETVSIFGGALLTGYALPGIGGLISGFMDHGVKGALVGGAAGIATGLVAAALLGSVSVVGLPFVLITGIASTFGGKSITNLIFGKKKRVTVPSADQIRSQLMDSVSKTMAELRESQVVEKWLKNTCDQLYSSVADNIDKEWENSLRSMEDTLTQIKIDLEMNAEAHKNTESSMNEYAESITHVLQIVQPIYEKLNSSLNQN